jgi:putative transcriptional regulator
MESSDMPVRTTLDAVLARRAMTAKDLAARMEISETQLSLFRSGKVRGIRFATLAKMCAVLDCAPGDLLDYAFDPADLAEAPGEAVSPE